MWPRDLQDADLACKGLTVFPQGRPPKLTKRGEGGHEGGQVGAWKRKGNEREQGEGMRSLRKIFSVLRAARDGFFLALKACQTAWGAALCSYECYTAYGAN